MVLRTFIFLIIFSISLIAQPFSPLPQPSNLSASNVDLGTFTQGSTTTAQIPIGLLSGYMPIILNSVTYPDATLSFTGTQIFADSNRAYTLGSIGDWVITGEQDSLLTTKPDSVFQYNNIPTELNWQNVNFDGWGYVNVVGELDFTTTWVRSGITVTDDSSFSSTASSGYIRLEGATTEGDLYRVIIEGTTDGQISLYDGTGGAVLIKPYYTGSINDTVYYIVSDAPTTSENFTILCSNSGTNVVINTLVLEKLVPPTGWTTSYSFTATNYCIEDINGIKLVSDGGSQDIRLNGCFEIGKQYIVETVVHSVTGSGYYYYDGSGFPSNYFLTSGAGTYTTTITADDTYLRLVRVSGGSTTMIISSISITEYHATNNISIGLNGLVENDYFDFTIGYQKDSLDGVPSFTWNGDTYTLNALSSTRQDSTFSLLARGNNSDTLVITVDDTCKWKLDVSALTTQKKLIEAGVNDSLDVTVDISTVGGFSKEIEYGHTGSNNGNTSTLTWEVTSPRELIALDGTAFDLDTGSVYAIDSLRFYNPSDVDFNVSQLGYWNGTSTLNPFGIYWNSTTIASGDTGTLYCDYTPFEDSTYTSYIYIKVKSTDLITQYDTTRLSISATAVLNTVPSLGTPVLAVTDSTDGITLSWSSVDNANGYIVYGKYSGGTYDTLAFTNSTTYFDEPNELANRNYYVVAYNSLESKTSNVITTSSEPTGTVIYVKLDNSTGYDAIADVNALPDNRKVFFYTGEQFDDALLDCNTGSIYGTYGGSAKAIIGDTTKVFDIDRTIRVNVNNVIVKNLIVLGYKNESDVITFTGTDLIFKNLIVNGGDGTNAHNYGTGIRQQSSSSTNITIYGNTIRDLRDGIYIAQPYNVEIAYNTMYNLFSYTGLVNYNAGTGIRQGTVQWDAEYTYWIHHNNIYNYEAMAIEHCPSNTLIEYNEIHHNLDERLYSGGCKHGNVGKLPDAGTGYSNTGIIFRYNYVHDLKKFGQPGYIYDKPTTADIIAQTIPTPLSTNNTEGNGAEVPWYYGVNNNSSYGDYYGDAESPDNVISGQGYYNMWIHNNIFEDCTGKIFSHSGGYTDGQRDDYSTHYVNNTIYNCGTGWHARTNVFTLELTQSDLYVENNIFDYNNPTAQYFGWFKKPNGLYLDYNLMTRQSADSVRRIIDGSERRINTTPSNDLALYDYYLDNPQGINVLHPASNGQYNQTPDWQDTTARFFAPHIGPKGAWITDLRIKKGGNAYNTGKPFDELGDAYTSTSANGTIAFGGTLGEDPTERSFAYDILGNLRTTNDLGALGIPQDSVFQTTPTIITQPTDLYASVGDTVQFTLSVSLPNGVVQCQWWELTDIGKMQDTGKYSGTTTNTLTISGIDSTHADLRFLCEVKNPNGYPQTGYWINSDVVQVYVSGVSGTAVQDTIYLVNNNYADVYRRYNTLYPELGYINLGYSVTTIDAGWVFENMNHYDNIDSAKVYLAANTTATPSGMVAQFKFQKSFTTSAFIDRDEFYSRIANVTTAYDSFPTDANSRVVGTFYGHDITNSITELNNTYTFTGTQDITLFGIGDASSSLMSFKSYEGGYTPYIVIWGTR